ncbi:ankyrin repeat-containing domain protein [Ochromonadaceae sp. CCMP2298]|nr:ankyrin repeat-containing domain protein [Ochromonadaceae sp. CCMP2298]
MQEEWPVMGMLSSMCKNASRRMTWADPSKVHLMPILVKSLPPSPLSLSITIRLVHVTKKEDYAIFDMIAAGDHVGVLNLLAAGAAGVAGGGGGNALDEWGQTPVMIAAQGNKLDLLAPLLNLRQPFVNFNLAKPSGFTALFYAVQQKQATVLTALLQRGADPNALLTVEGSRGTTPLHMACHLEKLKHIEELLKYGARPDATNQHGHVPLQLLPKDALRSTKLYLKKVFEVRGNRGMLKSGNLGIWEFGNMEYGNLVSYFFLSPFIIISVPPTLYPSSAPTSHATSPTPISPTHLPHRMRWSSGPPSRRQKGPRP